MAKLTKLVNIVDSLLEDAKGNLGEIQKIALYMQAMSTAVGNAQAEEFARLQQDLETADIFERAVSAVFEGVRQNPV